MSDLIDQSKLSTFEVTWRFLFTLALGGLGGYVFFLLGVPVGWLLGAVIAAAAAVQFSLPVLFPAKGRMVLLATLGVVFGERVTPETLNGLWLWPGSLMILGLTIVATVFLVERYAQRLGWTRDTALLAALPGALSAALAIAIERKADINKVLISQTMRVLVLVISTPLIVYFAGTSEVAETLSSASLSDFVLDQAELSFALHALAAFGGAMVLRKFKVPGAEILAGFFVAALTHGSGVVTFHSPNWIFLATNIALGCMIGSRLRLPRGAELYECLRGGAQLFVITLTVSLIGALLAAFALGLDPVLLFVAFAPGGFEAMLILTLALGLNPTFVLVHHLTRFIGILLALPFIFDKKGK